MLLPLLSIAQHPCAAAAAVLIVVVGIVAAPVSRPSFFLTS